MSIMIWDKTSQAFKESNDIKRFDSFTGTYKNVSNIYAHDGSTWKEKYPSEVRYNFGDGSLNSVVGGYTNKVYLSDLVNGTDSLITADIGNYGSAITTYCGNIKTWILRRGSTRLNPLPNAGGNTEISSTTNTYTTTSVTGNDKFYISLELNAGYNTMNATLSNLYIRLDNNWYTLKNGVDNNKIEPLVLMISSTGNGYYLNPVLNLYNNTGSASGSFFAAFIYFVPKSNVVFDGVRVTSNKRFETSQDGIMVTKCDNYLFTLGKL